MECDCWEEWSVTVGRETVWSVTVGRVWNVTVGGV